MNFTQKQIEQFKVEGYLPVPGFFSSLEVEAMRGELERFKREGKLRNVATELDGVTPAKTAANLQICPISPQHSPLLKALPFSPKVVGAVSSLIGAPALFILDQIFLKPGKSGAGTSWHADNAYFKIQDPSLGTGMWIALHDATELNGTMNVIPQSYKSEFSHTRDPESDHHIRCYPDESKSVLIELKAGGVLFFNYGVLHCTRANRTSNERAGLALHFAHVKADLSRWYGKGQQCPVISGPQARFGAEVWDEASLEWSQALEVQSGRVSMSPV